MQEGQKFYGYKHPLRQAWIRGEGGGGGGGSGVQKINFKTELNSCFCIRNIVSSMATESNFSTHAS